MLCVDTKVLPSHRGGNQEMINPLQIITTSWVSFNEPGYIVRYRIVAPVWAAYLLIKFNHPLKPIFGYPLAWILKKGGARIENMTEIAVN